jgi:hypothetical protein
MVEMLRHKNTDANGKLFSPSVIQAVWDKLVVSAEHAPLKMDAYGAVIWREAFGNNNSKLGWEIHHRLSVEQGGGDDLDNLEAIQWENHRRLDAESTKSADTSKDSRSERPEEATSQGLLPEASAAY